MSRNGFVSLLAIAVAAIVTAGCGSADETVTNLTGFTSPTGNIGCYIDRKSVRCDIGDRDWEPPRAPKSCDLDWGNAFNLRATGHASRLCVGDTAVDPRSPTLAYGRTWSRGGFTCKASTAGLRCTNRSGHGFFLSRSSQRLF